MIKNLLDVNVLVALAYKQHEHAPAAWKWAGKRQDACAFSICRVVQIGTFRLLTSRNVLKELVFSPGQVWQAWEQMLMDDRFHEVQEPLTLEATWREVAEALPPGMKLDTDTYLAAFAIAGGYTLVTFDRGFLKYPGLKVEILA